MLEKIKNQFEKKNVLLSSKYHHVCKREFYPKYFWEMYPLVEEYYHELNPYFLFNLHDPNIMQNFSDVYLVKDGYWTFANYLLNNLNLLMKSEDKLFLIHRDLTALIPENLRDRFAVWNIVKKKEMNIENIKRILIFAFISDEYLGDLKKNKKIESLKYLPQGVPVEVLFLNRRNLFEEKNKESFLCLELMNLVRDQLNGRSIKIVKSDDFFKTNDLRGTHFIDLAYDNFLVSDNYVHHFALSLGASMDDHLEMPPDNSIFSLALSFQHDLHISPLPKNANPELFSELVFKFKQNRAGMTSKTTQQYLRSFFEGKLQSHLPIE